jgi:hypothetical protein
MTEPAQRPAEDPVDYRAHDVEHAVHFGRWADAQHPSSWRSSIPRLLASNSAAARV